MNITESQRKAIIAKYKHELYRKRYASMSPGAKREYIERIKKWRAENKERCRIADRKFKDKLIAERGKIRHEKRRNYNGS